MLKPTPAAFGPSWIKESLRIQTGALTPARGLFWHPAPGTEPDQDFWVHYGFTGTGMWISPARGRWAILLTNKLRFNRDREPLTIIRNKFRLLAFPTDELQPQDWFVGSKSPQIQSCGTAVRSVWIG
ncbi:hypothetical protein EES37_27065 [Streptomyces sp. ADI91-18]|nr:hypothetical protein EES37_27065 [Streptomyces sp. ADI91-18]